MAAFTMTVAGFTARVQSLFDSTPHYFKEYLTDQPADFSVTVTREDLAHQRQMLYEEALEEGMRPRIFPEPFLERSAIQYAYAQALLDRDVLLLHGSTVAVDGRAYLFTAPCGTGKSTHTRLWMAHFGSRAVMVNDDKPFISIRPEGVFASGSPWCGKHGLGSNITVPLGGICLLRRGAQNRMEPATVQQILPTLLHQGCLPADPAKAAFYEALMTTLARSVPLWQMECTKDPEAAQVASRVMCP